VHSDTASCRLTCTIHKHPPGRLLQGLLKRVCHSKAAASGRELPAADAMALLESALFTAAREAKPRAVAAAGAAFQGSSAGPSPQVGH
jgi:hypothetical protein